MLFEVRPKRKNINDATKKCLAQKDETKETGYDEHIIVSDL